MRMVSHIECLLSFVHATRFDELTTTRTYMHSSTCCSRCRLWRLEGFGTQLCTSAHWAAFDLRKPLASLFVCNCILFFFLGVYNMRLGRIFWCSAHGLVRTQLATQSDRWTVILRAPNCTDRCSWNGPWSCHYVCSIASTLDGKTKALEFEA
jgi:hypothetical protein